METIEGEVSHLQNTISVTGGGNDSQATTTYIALFRLDGRPVQFRCGRPVAFADGDRLKAAGRARATDFLAYACRNLTTGSTYNSGIWGNVIAAVFLPIFGLIFCWFASMLLGHLAALIYVFFLAGAAYCVYRAVMTSTALGLVRE